MTNTITVVSWNAEGMFVDGTKTRRGDSHSALSVIRDLAADVVVIPEFGKHEKLTPEIRNTLHYLGYEIIETPYDDDYVPKLALVVLSRLPVHSTSIIRLANVRNAIEVVVSDDSGKKIRIFGVHFDDRSEETRLKQAKDLVDAIDKNPDTMTLLMGDFNAMKKQSTFAELARSSFGRYAAQRINHDLLRSMALRVNEMALGTTIEYISQRSSLKDMDPGHRRTVSGKQAGVEWIPKLRIAKIDWIFASPSFQTISYHVWRDVGSDHRPIRAVLKYK